MSNTTQATAVIVRRLFCLFVLLPALISLAASAPAWADIFKWTDEQGKINISNVPPPSAGKAKNIEIVLKETKPTPIEQALLARIENLERQQQARQYAVQASAGPPPMPYGGYYPPTPPPPPPPSYYDSGYDTGYDSSYSPSYYPTYYPSYYPTYSYPVVRSYSYASYPARAYMTRPVFAAPRGGSFHGGGSFRGGGGHSGGHGGRR